MEEGGDIGCATKQVRCGAEILVLICNNCERCGAVQLEVISRQDATEGSRIGIFSAELSLGKVSFNFFEKTHRAARDKIYSAYTRLIGSHRSRPNILEAEHRANLRGSCEDFSLHIFWSTSTLTLARRSTASPSPVETTTTTTTGHQWYRRNHHYRRHHHHRRSAYPPPVLAAGVAR